MSNRQLKKRMIVRFAPLFQTLVTLIIIPSANPKNRPNTRFMGPMAYCQAALPLVWMNACSMQLKPMMQVASSKQQHVMQKLGASARVAERQWRRTSEIHSWQNCHARVCYDAHRTCGRAP